MIFNVLFLDGDQKPKHRVDAYRADYIFRLYPHEDAAVLVKSRTNPESVGRRFTTAELAAELENCIKDRVIDWQTEQANIKLGIHARHCMWQCPIAEYRTPHCTCGAYLYEDNRRAENDSDKET